MLRGRHKIDRFEIQQQIMSCDNQWIGIFFPVKKWHLDGPEELKRYWLVLRKETDVLSKCKWSGGSLMTWMQFAYNMWDQLLSFRVKWIYKRTNVF